MQGIVLSSINVEARGACTIQLTAIRYLKMGPAHDDRAVTDKANSGSRPQASSSNPAYSFEQAASATSKAIDLAALEANLKFAEGIQA